MADIRKRVGKKGTTYQVRYPSKSTKSGYAFKSFDTLKEARAFLESGDARKATASPQPEFRSVQEATHRWLQICEKEGLNGREPVTLYTLQNYEYRTRLITAYDWPRDIQNLTAPDVVTFRSWLLSQNVSRELASKVLSTLHSIAKEMVLRGVIPHNFAAGVSIRADSRYKQPPSIPSESDIYALLSAADSLANDKNQTIAKAWQRYRPILYLAVDSGMRPQEYLGLSHKAVKSRGVYIDRAIDGSGYSLTVTKTPAGRRFIDLNPEILEMIQHYLEHNTRPNDYELVFPANNGNWMCRKNWQRRGFDVACEKAGLMEVRLKDGKEITRSKYRPYDLRHFYASMHIDRGTNLKKLQTLMGHTNIETTLNVYGHLLDKAEDDTTVDGGVIGLLSQNSCGKPVAPSS